MATPLTIYKQKNEFLSEWATPIKPVDFYKNIFPPDTIESPKILEDAKPNPIFGYSTYDAASGKSWFLNEICFNDYKAVDKMYKKNMAVCTLCTYIGRRRKSKNARFLYGFCVDLDGVTLKELKTLKYGILNEVLPYPSYINNSGGGLHIYFIFYEPIPLYKSLVPYLQQMKEGLTLALWRPNETTNYQQIQKQGIYQPFRVPGSKTKLNQKYKGFYPVTAFDFNHRVDLMELNEYLPKAYQVPENVTNYGSGNWADSRLTLAEAKELYPEWYQRRIVDGIPYNPRADWLCNKGLYDWWLEKISHEAIAIDGNRFNCIAVLFIYAVKCGLPKKIPLADAKDLLSFFDGLTEHEENHFTQDDIYAASQFYNNEYVKMSIRSIEKRVGNGLHIPRNRRNGRKQSEHLKIARFVQSMSDKNWRNVNGRPSKQKIVLEWRKLNPDGSKNQCIRETKLSKHTVIKWWEEK